MTTFRIDHSRPSIAPRVYHKSDNKLAVALIFSEEDGTVTLFRSRWDDVPSPIVEQSKPFPDEQAVRAFLGIEEGDRA